jgi:hypothetical protein
MMTPELVEVSKRIIRLNSWEWLPGMLGVRDSSPENDDYLKPEIRIRGLDDIEVVQVFGSIPDLTDAATLGCLLELVRRAAKDPRAYLCDYNGYDSVEWGICSDVISNIREELNLKPKGWMRILVADAQTEGLALALSIEEAEKFYDSINKQSKQSFGRV